MLASNFITLIPSCLIRQMLANLLELNSKGLYESSRQEKQSSSCVPVLDKTWNYALSNNKVVVLLNMKLLLFCHSCCHHCRRCLSFLLLLKGLCHVCLVHFVNNANCRSFLAMELEKLIVNGKIIASSQTNMPPKHNIKHNKNKNELWKTVKLTSFQKAQLNLFQSSSSLSICSSFCICCVTYNHLLFMFWAVIFVFHSVWWWLLLFEFW